jgi:acetyl-CoA acetyltransferase
MLMARAVSILSDLPIETGGKVVNRFCGSSMDSVHQLSQAILAGDIIVGCAFPEGPQGMLMARAVSILSDLPIETGGKVVNRFCGSSMDSVHQLSQAILAGDIIVGCAFPEGEQGFNIGKLVTFLSGMDIKTLLSFRKSTSNNNIFYFNRINFCFGN